LPAQNKNPWFFETGDFYFKKYSPQKICFKQKKHYFFLLQEKGFSVLFFTKNSAENFISNILLDTVD